MTYWVNDLDVTGLDGGQRPWPGLNRSGMSDIAHQSNYIVTQFRHNADQALFWYNEKLAAVFDVKQSVKAWIPRIMTGCFEPVWWLRFKVTHYCTIEAR